MQVLSTIDSLFMQHVASHGLSYGTMEEYNFRKTLFDQVDKEIKEFNEAPEQTSRIAHNFTSTMTQGEKKRMLGFKGHGEVKKAVVLEEANYDSINWVTAGKVNPV
jgi:hypothetical protein